MDNLVVRRTWWTRMLRGLRLLPSGETEHVMGADFAPDHAATPGYDPAQAMSAYPADPWIAAGANAKATDLSGLPLVAIRGFGTDAEQLDDHPALELLRRPSSRITGVLLRRQIVVDWLLSGMAYMRVIGEREPQALLRLPPQRCRVLPWADGQPGKIEFDGAGTSEEIPWDEVLLVRSPSWEDTPAGLYGQGAIRPLHDGLTAILAARRASAKAAEIGRPTGLVRPKDTGDEWNATQIGIIRDGYLKQMKGGTGLLILGGAADYEALGWSPREMEFVAQAEAYRAEALAVLDVPPVRVGIPNANYATDQAQGRRYWESLRGNAALIDAELSRLAAMFGDLDVRIAHDFSGVEELQESRTERLNRVQMLWFMGATPAEAAKYEGFEDAPLPGALKAPPAPGQEDDEPAEDRGAESAAIARAFHLAAPVVVEEAWTAPVTEEARAAEWRGFADQLHTPLERELVAVMLAFLRAQALRMVARLAEVVAEPRMVEPDGMVARAFTEEDLEDIVAEKVEGKAMDVATREVLQEGLKLSYRRAVQQVGAGPSEFPATRLNTLVDEVLGDMVTHVGATTKSGVRSIVTDGIAEGATIAEMQAKLQTSHLFGPMRALRIARTETTHSVNAGALVAYDEAAAAGVDVQVEWLSARDDVVRETHAEIDGTVVDRGEDFVLSDGDSGRAPGDFSNPANVINCRCTVLPVVRDEE